ncbi:hypothetical protein [Sinomonas sp. RB5]
MDSPSPEEAARRAAVMRHHEPVDGEDPGVGPPPPAVPIRVVAYDAAWPAQFHEVAAGIRADPAEVPQVNLHVFAPGCPEAERHRMFRAAGWIDDPQATSSR